MKHTFTCLFILFIHCGFTQTVKEDALAEKPTQHNYQVVIENLPSPSQETTVLAIDLHSRGSYSFKLAQQPDENLSVILKDPKTGNTFDLCSPEPHHLSINRPMTRSFLLEVRLKQEKPASALVCESKVKE